MKTPLLFAGSSSPPTVGNTRYCGMVSGHGAGAIWLTTDTQRTPIPISCSFVALEIHVPAVQTGANQSTLTLMKNAVATLLAATVDSSSTRKSDFNSVGFNAGEDASVKVVVSADGVSTIRAGFLVVAGTPGESMILGGGAGTALGYHPFGTYDADIAEADAASIIAAAGVIDNIYIRENVAPGSGNTWRYTLYKNGSPTAQTVDMSGTNQTANTVGIAGVAVVQGDLISLRRDPVVGSTHAASMCRYGARFVPTIYGESLQFNKWTTLTNGSDRFGNINGDSDSNTGTETTIYNIIPYPCVLKKKVMSFITAPGGSVSRGMWVRKGLVGGSQADTSLTVSITGANTVATPDNTNEVTISASDVATGALVDYRTINSGGVPAAPGRIRDGLVTYIAAEAPSSKKGLIGGGVRVGGII